VDREKSMFRDLAESVYNGNNGKALNIERKWSE